MAKVVTGYSWSNEQITPALLNQMWTSATFNASAVDDSTTALSGGAVIVKDGGVVADKLATNSVITVKIADDAVTTAKILDDNVTTAKILDDNITTAKILNDAVTHDKVDTATKAEMEGESAAGVCVPDILKHHPGVAAAWGVITFDTSTPALVAGYNVSSTVGEPTEDHRHIAFTNNMASANYVVIAAIDTGINSYPPFVLNQAASGFDLDAAAVDTTGYRFHFVVYGQLA